LALTQELRRPIETAALSGVDTGTYCLSQAAGATPFLSEMRFGLGQLLIRVPAAANTKIKKGNPDDKNFTSP